MANLQTQVIGRVVSYTSILTITTATDPAFSVISWIQTNLNRVLSVLGLNITSCVDSVVVLRTYAIGSTLTAYEVQLILTTT